MANTKAIGVAYADPSFDSVQVGSSSAPIALTSSGVLNGSYATTSATSGDTRLSYQKLTFTSTGSGEVVRGFAVVTGTGGATAGTINGAHFSMEVQGGTYLDWPVHKVDGEDYQLIQAAALFRANKELEAKLKEAQENAENKAKDQECGETLNPGCTD